MKMATCIYRCIYMDADNNNIFIRTFCYIRGISKCTRFIVHMLVQNLIKLLSIKHVRRDQGRKTKERIGTLRLASADRGRGGEMELQLLETLLVVCLVPPYAQVFIGVRRNARPHGQPTSTVRSKSRQKGYRPCKKSTPPSPKINTGFVSFVINEPHLQKYSVRAGWLAAVYMQILDL